MHLEGGGEEMPRPCHLAPDTSRQSPVDDLGRFESTRVRVYLFRTLDNRSLAAERLRPEGRGGGGWTTDFSPHSFHATSIGLMLKYSIQGGHDAPVPPPPFRRLCNR